MTTASNTNTNSNNEEKDDKKTKPSHEASDEDLDDDTNRKIYVQPPLTKAQSNVFFKEPLFIGNLHIISNGSRFHRWIMFLSSSDSEIIPTVSVKSVEYILHNTFQPPNRYRDQVPFFLDCTGWGVFALRVKIRFKDHYLRDELNAQYTLSFSKPTSLENVVDVNQTGQLKTKKSFNHLFEFEHFEPYIHKHVVKYEGKQASKMFMKKTSSRLDRNLTKLPAIIQFESFNMRLPQFIEALGNTELVNQLGVSMSSLFIIAQYTILCKEFGLRDGIRINSSLLIDKCSDCDVLIDARKIKHLTVRNCSNMSIEFIDCMSSCELHYSSNIEIQCNGHLYHYRFDSCKNCRVVFFDYGMRMQFLSFDSPNISLMVRKILWMSNEYALRKLERDERRARARAQKSNNDSGDSGDSDDLGIAVQNAENRPTYLEYSVPYESGPWERASVRWRTQKNPEFTARVFKPVIGFGSI